MKCTFVKTLVCGLAVQLVLLQCSWGLPIASESSAAEGDFDDVIIDDPCEGLPCDEWTEVQKRKALLLALQAKDTDTLLDSINQEDQNTDLDGENEGDDILFTPEQINEFLQEAAEEQKDNHRQKRKVISRDYYRWDMPVHYIIEENFKDDQKKIIRKAIKQWEENTCISFLELDSDAEPNYKHVVFKTKVSGCASYVGKVNLASNYQPIYLASSCFQKFGTPVHEIGHALGLWHEHQRPSREGHIEIMEENVITHYLGNFRSKLANRVKDYGIPFDYNSVMHYGGKIGSKNGKYTIRTLDELYQGSIGQRAGLSFLDAKAINHAYCEDMCKSSDLRRPCQHGGYQDPKKCDSCRCPPGLSGQYCQTTAPSLNALCGDHVELKPGEEITVSSPRYDTEDNYGNFLECNWLFKVPSGSHLQIDFQDKFGVYSSVSGICMHWLEIKHSDDFGKPGPRFCGQELPTAVLKSEGQEVLMTFRSNHGVTASQKTRGFKVRVMAVEKDEGETDDRETTDATTTTSTPSTTTTTPTTSSETTTTTTATEQTVKPRASSPTRVTWGEWGKCVSTSLNCGCGGCAVRSRERFCDGEVCGKQTETCSRVCTKEDKYKFFIGKFYIRDCPECCPGFHKVDNVCKKNES